MEAWQNDPVVTPQDGAASANAEPWKSDPIVQPPKIPDMSGVQKAAQQNSPHRGCGCDILYREGPLNLAKIALWIKCS